MALHSSRSPSDSAASASGFLAITCEPPKACTGYHHICETPDTTCGVVLGGWCLALQSSRSPSDSAERDSARVDIACFGDYGCGSEAGSYVRLIDFCITHL